jgi:Tfp pilus assembly protein PilE
MCKAPSKSRRNSEPQSAQRDEQYRKTAPAPAPANMHQPFHRKKDHHQQQQPQQQQQKSTINNKQQL